MSVELPEAFRGFGEPILTTAAATVVIAHNGEPDHVARRSQIALLPYALGPSGPSVLLAHLRSGTVRVAEGDLLASGDQVGECGNSGNSTQPHAHVQVVDSLDWPTPMPT